jgi:hypothetical protein
LIAPTSQAIRICHGQRAWFPPSGLDHRGGRFLSNVADTYAKTFYALDGNQTIISSARPPKPHSAVLLHQQTIEDIAHEGYRAACYHQPDVSRLLSLLPQPSQDIWLSVTSLFLARFAMLAIDKIDDPAVAPNLIDDASEGMIESALQ